MGKYLTADYANLRWQAALYESSERFDLVIASHCQLELRGQPSRDLLVKNLWNRVAPGGVLVLIEPGTPTGFRFMHHTRELFIRDISDEHFHFVAPCPHEGPCPLAFTGRDWCHFSQRIFRLDHKLYTKGSRSKIVEEEKFSFLALRRGPGPP